VFILELLSVSLARGNCQDLGLGDNGDSAVKLLRNTSDDKSSNMMVERKTVFEKIREVLLCGLFISSEIFKHEVTLDDVRWHSYFVDAADKLLRQG
jgi:hypothetical protein